MTFQKRETPPADEVSQNTRQNTYAPTLTQLVPDRKELETTRARFALLGHTLTVSRRADDGRHTWAVSRWNQSRHLSHWSDVLAHLTQVEGAP